jgi:hypothetical protein
MEVMVLIEIVTDQADRESGSDEQQECPRVAAPGAW